MSTIEKWVWSAGLAATLLMWSGAAQAQYPGRPAGDKKDAAPVARATAVLEWTGDVSKPTASRLVPIAVFDGSQYQPGALYLAKPQPLALDTGTVYQLEQAGVARGEYDIDAARQVNGSWVGIGKWKGIAVAKVTKLKESKIMPQVVMDKDPDKPTLHRQPGSEGDAPKAGAAGGDSSQTKTGDAKASQDADRPTLHKRTGDSTSSSTPDTSASQAGSGQAPASSAPEVDADRPTLHKHEDEKSGKAGSDQAVAAAPVTATTETDPDRPKLQHGKPGEQEKMLEPDKLGGLPADMQQMAAVSDAKSREPHGFAYQWASPAEGAKMQAEMEELAKKALGGDGNKSSAPQPAKAAAKPSATRASMRRKAATQPTAPVADLANEKFAAYELSYSGGSTLVLTAESTNAGDAKKYVTVLAQPDFYGALKVLMQSVTSEPTLDATPKMRLVDAVDTDGDNRAELVFELRGRTDRQFAIYRVAGGRVNQVFTTGTLP